MLDAQHEELEHIRTDDAYAAWELAHRTHGESMNMWINNIMKLKLELEAQDPEVVVTTRGYASKQMRGSGLITKERAQALFLCWQSL